MFSQLFFRDKAQKKQYNDSASKYLCECFVDVFTAVREDVPKRMPELDLSKVVRTICYFIGGSNPPHDENVASGLEK